MAERERAMRMSFLMAVERRWTTKMGGEVLDGGGGNVVLRVIESKGLLESDRSR